MEHEELKEPQLLKILIVVPEYESDQLTKILLNLKRIQGFGEEWTVQTCQYIPASKRIRILVPTADGNTASAVLPLLEICQQLKFDAVVMKSGVGFSPNAVKVLAFTVEKMLTVRSDRPVIFAYSNDIRVIAVKVAKIVTRLKESNQDKPDVERPTSDPLLVEVPTTGQDETNRQEPLAG
jgi:hypothetical protein